MKEFIFLNFKKIHRYFFINYLIFETFLAIFKDDPNANEAFIEINRAYEILKDEDLRKKYDTFGEDGLKENHNAGQQYQNWNFYQHNFGIYDDDPEVVTLTRTDFSNYFSVFS